MESASTGIRRALKEWPAVIRALRGGRQIILLRKGGLIEPHGEFRAQAGEFLLYPSHEHERLELLKPEEASRWADLGLAGQAGALLRIDTFVRLVDALEVRDPLRVFALAEHHIWNEAFVRQRVEYKPERPLQVLIVRAWALPGVVELPFRERYQGCRSWVELEEEVSLEGRLACPRRGGVSTSRRRGEAGHRSGSVTRPEPARGGPGWGRGRRHHHVSPVRPGLPMSR